MNFPPKILAHGAILAVSVFVYSALAIGAFQQYFHAASVVWMLMLVGLGILVRRWIWPKATTASAVIVVGLLFFFLILLGLAATSSSNPGFAASFSGAVQLGSIYVPWFWLPFAVGTGLGGINRKHPKTERKGV